ncbi:hypothetical protein ACKI2C_51480, partial [Streptomyces brasiliscabiei]|uniref:hypothetical protein n=1 Tax=Streptomyces brasiliscabiei TaxID=2736302 RepID=UPI0038F6723C
MSQTILLSHTGDLRELFFGEWRKIYNTIRDQETFSLGQFCHVLSSPNYTLPQLKRSIVKT